MRVMQKCWQMTEEMNTLAGVTHTSDQDEASRREKIAIKLVNYSK